MEKVNVTINGIKVQVPANYTILQAAHEAGVKIPTLCYLKDINAIAACRICLVEATGVRGLAAACVQQVAEGMEVKTNTPELRQSRKTTLELMLSNHRMDCLSCVRSNDCELRQLAQEYGVDQYAYVGNETLPAEETVAAGDAGKKVRCSVCGELVAEGTEACPICGAPASAFTAVDMGDMSPRILRDNSKCILCRRCIAVCQKLQHVAVIGANDRGFETHVASAFDMPLTSTSCVNCGQCIAVCPTGALRERDDTDKVWAALNDPTKHVVVGPAPSVRAQLGEYFDYPIGTNVEGKLAAALRRLGFDKVFDVDTAADVTIMEEGTELLDRIQNGGALPLLTSCSPGWVKFCESYYPEMIPNISSCKSPQQMFGALIKTYYAEKNGIDPKDIVVVSIMPCTAKKFEIAREDMSAAGEGIRDVDVSLTTRELASMIKRAGIMFKSLPDETFDPAFGVASGAGHIFGATGGVMEAALRTVAEIVTGKPLEKVEFHEVRGTEGIKEAEYDLAGTKVRVAVTSGLSNAKKLLDMVKSGEKDYHFIEVMACPGGCVNGGGQPHQSGDVRNFTDLRAERAKALYSEDAGMELRKSHENPVVKELYETYLEKPGSHKAHHILHTSYVARKVY